MKRILAAAALAAVLARPAGAICTNTTGSLVLKKPTVGDSGQVWADCLRYDFDLLSSSVALVAASTTTAYHFGEIYVNRIGGRSTGTPNIRLSSSVYQDAGTFFTTYGTMTVVGNAFSVGSSTLVVAGGLLGVGVNPSTIFQVGAATFSVASTSGGRIGVGTTSPGTMVHANASFSTGDADVRLQSDYGNGFAAMTGSGQGANTRGKFFLNSGTSPDATKGIAICGASADDCLQGHVGVGTKSPVGPFQVGGGTLTVVNGRVGIGTTNPSVYKLYIDGGSAPLAIDGSGHIVFLVGTSQKGVLQHSGNDLQYYNVAAGANMLVVTGTGFVGIKTSNPATTLDVEGTLQAGSGATKSTFTTTGSLTLNTNASLQVGTTFYVGNGRVGVGTTSPITNLHVKGGDPTTMTVESGGSGQAARISMSDGETWTVETKNDAMSFAESGVGSRLYMENTGNVGVGTTIPATRLDVAGSAQFASGVSRSTFNATPSATVYSLNLSSGLAVALGHVKFPDGTRQFTAAGSGTGDFINGSNNTTTGNNTHTGTETFTGPIVSSQTAAAWVVFVGTGTVTIMKSNNVASITDNGTGVYVVNLAITMADAFYAVSIESMRSLNPNANAHCHLDGDSPPSATAFGIECGEAEAYTVEDQAKVHAVIYGNR